VWVFVTSQRVAMCVFLCGGSDLCWVSACCRGVGGLWPVGIKDGVKDCDGKYSLVVIQVVICSEFCVDVKLFNRVQVGYFSVVMQHLHNIFYWAEGVCFFIKVPGEV